MTTTPPLYHVGDTFYQVVKELYLSSSGYWVVKVKVPSGVLFIFECRSVFELLCVSIVVLSIVVFRLCRVYG